MAASAFAHNKTMTCESLSRWREFSFLPHGYEDLPAWSFAAASPKAKNQHHFIVIKGLTKG